MNAKKIPRDRRLQPILAGLLACILATACTEEEAAAPAPASSPSASSASRDRGPAIEHNPHQVIFNDTQWDLTDPDLAVARDGDVALVWRAFNGTRDHIFASLEVDHIWRKVSQISGKAEHHLPPRVIEDPRGGFLVVWSARVDGQYDIFARHIGGDAPSDVQRVTTHPGNDIAPALVAGWDGRIWLAWESDRNGHPDVYAKLGDPNGWTPPWRVTEHPLADFQPSLGLGPDGTVWIAWTTWRDGRYADGNYEVYAAPLRRESAEPGMRVSRSDRTDMDPAFVQLRDTLALVWTESYFPNLTVGDITAVQYDNWADKTYQVSWLEGDRFGAPVGKRLSPDEARGSVASPQFKAIADADGEAVWIFFGDRVVKDAFDRTWALKLCRIDRAGAVSVPIDLARDVTGPTQRYAAGVEEGRFWVVDVAVAQIPDASAAKRALLRVRSIKSDRLPPWQPLGEIRAEPRTPVVESLRLDETLSERAEVTLGDARWSAFFGNLHLHSDYSGDRRGFEGEIQHNFRVVDDMARLDFAGLSDHAEGLRPVDWWNTRALLDLWNRPGRFVTVPGYEWTSLRYGHKNVFFPDTQEAAVAEPFPAPGKTPADLWTHLDGRRAIAIPHHTSHGFRQPTDWSFRNDRYQRLVEIFQKRGSYEYDGAPLADIPAHFVPGHSVRAALGKGHRLGIIASPDHGGGMGLAGVWASELSREAVWEALHARRTFGTTGAKIDLFFTAAGAPQGAEVAADGPRFALNGRVNGTAKGLTLTLVRDGEEIQEWVSTDASATFAWEDEAPTEGPSYYYLRAVQFDGHIGWTSPIWVWPVGARIPPEYE